MPSAVLEFIIEELVEVRDCVRGPAPPSWPRGEAVVGVLCPHELVVQEQARELCCELEGVAMVVAELMVAVRPPEDMEVID